MEDLFFFFFFVLLILGLGWGREVLGDGNTWVVTTKGPKWIGGMPLRAGGIVGCSVMYFLVSWFEFEFSDWYTGVYRSLGARWSWFVKLC